MKLSYRLTNILYDFRCRCQRFKRGWADGDAYDIDTWFIKTVEPMLKHLRDHGCAVPDELYDENLDSREKWEETLNEMAYCLHLMNRDNARMALGIQRIAPMAHQDHERINKLVEENKNRFFELFSKYFFDLWD